MYVHAYMYKRPLWKKSSLTCFYVSYYISEYLPDSPQTLIFKSLHWYENPSIRQSEQAEL